MKHVVVQTDLHESDIRPASLMSRFRELSIEDSRQYFGDAEALIDIDCPSCGGGKKPAFEKNGFQYQQCTQCASVFVSPRPSRERLADYYQNSRAVHYRAEHLNLATAEARRVHILRSNANWLGRLVDEAGQAQTRKYGDRGTNYPMLFEEVRKLGLFDRYYGIHPLKGMEDACSQAGAILTAEPVGDLAALTGFEQLEHQFSALDFLKECCGMLAPGGMIFLTTRTIDGFDLATLWDKTPYIYVPEHLNLFSIEGLGHLLENAGFELVELSTPGQLDVELTMAAARADTSIALSGFLKTLFEQRDEEARRDFQAFLQKHRLSSHVRIAAVKKTEEK